MNPELELPPAVPLLGAMAWRLAERSSIRALVIKGAPATAMGVRSDRPSIDVDLWVDPVRFDDYVGILHDRGWRRYAARDLGVGFGHAVTMTHPAWPCTVDIHRRFPGLLEDDQVVFDWVWARRTTALVGRQHVAVPSLVSAAAISVLHAIRSTSRGRTAEDLQCSLAAAARFSARERQELMDLASTTRSAEPLAQLLRVVGCDPTSTMPAADRLDEWRLQLRARRQVGGPFILAMRRSPWSRRIQLIQANGWPSDADYAATGGDRGVRGTVRATLHRWGVGVRALPGAWRASRID